ncbi:RNA recognition motif-containing protein [Chytridiales sp. JEL 0842]|nr:RNA recognition motif-containing protein [Chytridiales sp. JEL 0842]
MAMTSKKNRKHSKSSAADEKDRSKSTVFVRNLPFTASSQDLETFFGEIGPLRSCFVVSDSSKQSAALAEDGEKQLVKNKGFGFVHFAIQEDAARAVKELEGKVFPGGTKKLKLELAIKRSVVKKSAKNESVPDAAADGTLGVTAEETETTEPAEDSAVKAETASKPTTTKPIPKPHLKPKHTRTKSIHLTALPSNLTKKQLNHKLRKFGTINELIFPLSSQNDEEAVELPGEAQVTYSRFEEAEEALKKLDGHIFKGVKIGAELHFTFDSSKTSKSARLMFRNLPFNLTSDHLATILSEKLEIPQSSIKETSIPTQPNNANLNRGFGFVQFEDLEVAKKCVEMLNGQRLTEGGRVVKVDWAVAKGVYEREKVVEEQVEETEDVEMEDVEEDKEEEEGEGEMEEEEEEEEEEHDEEQEEEEEEKEDAAAESDDEDDVQIVYEGEEEEEDESDSTPSDAEEDAQIQKSESTTARTGRLASNVSEKCTLFIRNLPFEATEDELKEKFLPFGKLRYARITLDPVTKHSRGTGFVNFFNASDASACLDLYNKAVEAHSLITNSTTATTVSEKKKEKPTEKSLLVAEPSKTSTLVSQFTLHSRLLNLSLAVTRSEATSLASVNARERRKKDKRNLYLMKEGVVFPNSKEAVGVSASELSKRQKSFAERRRLLETNPNLFISRTRLSVRNLHPKITDHLLRRMGILSVMRFREEASTGVRTPLEQEVVDEELEAGLEKPEGNRRIQVVKSKVLLDLDRIDPKTNKPKSKGYAFLEFGSHADALSCLRWLNNNPFAFTADGRVATKEEYLAAKKAYKPPKPTLDEKEKEGAGYLKRPIVEFAVENRNVVMKQEERKKAQEGKRKEMKEKFVEKKKRKKGEEAGEEEGGRKKFRKGDKKEGGQGEKKVFNKGGEKKGREKKESGEKPATPAPSAPKNNKRKPAPSTEPAQQPPSQQPPSKKPKQAPQPETQPKIPKKMSKADAKFNAEESQFSKLLEKYGKGLFGTEKSSEGGKKKEEGGAAGGIKKWYS